MKRIIFTSVILMAVTAAFGQTVADSTKKNADTTQKSGPKFSVNYWNHHRRDTTRNSNKRYPRGFIGITLSRFDLGLATLVDNNSFTLSPQNQFLRYRSWKTSNVGFDVFQMGERFNHNFRIYLSAGFDWTLIRLEDNITILPNQPVLTYKQDNIDFSKNRFSSSYLRIPLSFDFRTNEDSRGNRWHFVLGPDGGFLLGGMVKQISAEYGKQKFYNSYNYTTFRYGGFFRIGYGDFGIFAKYYVNDMFENSPEQDGLRNFSFGFTLGF